MSKRPLTSAEARRKRAIYAARWRAANREANREYMREFMKQYWIDNPRQREKQRVRVGKNNEKYRKEGRYKNSWKDYVKRHGREYVKRKQQEYYQKNRDRIRAHQNEYLRLKRKADKV